LVEVGLIDEKFTKYEKMIKHDRDDGGSGDNKGDKEKDAR